MNPIEVYINCYTCSPKDYESACDKLDEYFKSCDTEDESSVEWGDFEAGRNVLVRIHNVPEGDLEWAYKKIEDAMQDISSWSIES